MSKSLEKVIISNSFKETQDFGGEFAKTLKGGELIALYGNLGGGKTTFVQGIALGLGIKRRVISPTFIIMRSYKALINKKIKNFFHLDLYRIETADDIIGLEIDEIMGNSNNVIVIEWAQNLRDFLPKKRIDIYFEYLDENKRKIKVINNGISN